MTDLEINIALAKTMGWDDLQMDYFGNPMQILVPQHRDILYCWDMGIRRLFDYRDPVIFVAICKHWKLTIFHNCLHCYCAPALLDFNADTIEKAAALCVIDAVKRGVK
jgi:hypothetical protein